jgi:hypothetical protein
MGDFWGSLLVVAVVLVVGLGLLQAFGRIGPRGPK